VIRARAAALACSLLLPALGCGNGPGNENPYPTPGTGGSLGHMPSGTVEIAIEAPATDLTFGAGTLIPIQARVTVQSGTDFIDTASVRAYITRDGGTTMPETGKLVPAGADLYTGRISLAADLPNDTYTLWVTASTSGGATGKQSVNFTIDSGPTITITSPAEGGSYRTSLIVEVKVDSGPFDLMGPPTATVGPVNVMLTAIDDPPTIYRGEVKFDYDPNQQPLTGAQLLSVVATNVNGKRTEAQLVFIVDDQGPVISGTRPAPGEMVGGIVNIQATIQDNAGVLDASVIAVIGDETGTPLFELPLKPRGAGTYGVLFDTAKLTSCKPWPSTDLCIVFPTVSFRASDLVGNETVIGYDFFVDNIPPLADLDPPYVRDTKLDGVLRCSHAFNPLGVDKYAGDMPNDGKVVPQVFDLRARIEDGGNRAAGLKRPPISLVDPNDTYVYILDDTSQALVVDSDGDGSCDAINPLLIPTTEPPTQNNQVLKVRLAPVPAQGTSDFPPDGTVPANAPCVSGLDPEPPEPLCGWDQPTIAITYAFGQPAIWSVEPINQLRCHGNQFDSLANNIGEQWACIAVGTRDQAGNFSVSAPLRVYIDYDFGNGTTGYSFGSSPPSSAGAPPGCRGTFANGAVTAGSSCTTRGYPSGEYCYRGDCN